MEREIRRKKRNVRGTRNIFIAAVAAVIIAVFIIAIRGQVKENENYISRALASRMLVLLGTDSLADVQQDSAKWYVKYMSYLNDTGRVIWDGGNYTEPEYAYSAITYAQLRNILTAEGWDVGEISDYTGIKLDKGKGDKKVKRFKRGCRRGDKKGNYDSGNSCQYVCKADSRVWKMELCCT